MRLRLRMTRPPCDFFTQLEIKSPFRYIGTPRRELPVIRFKQKWQQTIQECFEQ